MNGKENDDADGLRGGTSSLGGCVGRRGGEGQPGAGGPGCTGKGRLWGWQVGSAFLMLGAGVALAGVALLLPPKGEIADSVCWVFAQCLIYAGSVFGLAGYVEGRLRGR